MYEIMNEKNEKWGEGYSKKSTWKPHAFIHVAEMGKFSHFPIIQSNFLRNAIVL